MHAVEDRMWWYRGLRALTTELLARALSRSGATGLVLDAGCGTGGMMARLRAWRGGFVEESEAAATLDQVEPVLGATRPVHAAHATRRPGGEPSPRGRVPCRA